MNTLLMRSSRLVQPVFATLLCAVVIGIPLWLALITSAKSQGQALNPDLSLPTKWEFFQNFSQAINEGNLFQGFMWSVIVVVPTVFLVILFGSMAAWVFARRSGRGISLLYAVAVSGILIPPAVVTLVLVLRQIGLESSAIGLVAAYTGMYLATVIFFVTGFVRTIPVELEEAARIDGASPFKTFFTIVFPLLRPVIATASILVTLFAWNDVYYAFFIVGGSPYATMPLNLYNIASAAVYLNNWNLIFAYVILMSIPLVLVFIFGQRRIISGITSGAVK
jgi:raffinose/stachyose/melibiose transport system permease protein